MTAIAAVLAFSTPAMAQEVTPTPVTATPVTATPAPVAPAPVAPPVSTIAPDVDATATASDPLSPDAAAPAPAVAVDRASPRVTSKRATGAVSRAAPAPRRATTATAAPVRPRAATPLPVAPSAPLEPAPSIPAAATAEPLAEPVAISAPAAQPAPTEIATDNSLEIAGAAGLGLLALLGLGAAFRRRSRRDEDDAVAFEQPIEAPMAPAAFAEPMREPAIRRDLPVEAASNPAIVGKPIAAPAANLPEGFDLSRFGPHVQAAYRGPTEDNPSLSLKHRLRRASALDQMARRDGTDLAAPATRAAAPANPGTVVSRMRPAPAAGEGFMLGKGAVRPSLRPVTQH